MVRNRLLLVCATTLGVGAWIAWESFHHGELGDRVSPVVATSAASEPTASFPPVLDGVSEMAPPERVSASLELKVNPTSPVLVAGVVVDDGGTPVGSADVYIPDDREESAVASSDDPRRLASTKSDRSGHFEIRESIGEPHLVLRARKRGFFDSEPVPFEPGATDARLVLSRGGVVAGRLLVDPGIPADSLRLQLRSPDESMPYRRSEIPWKDGRFAFGNVVARTVTLSVNLSGQDSSIVEVGSVRVPKIGGTPDPRLDPLDLRGSLEFLTIEVEDSAARTCSDASVVLRDPGGRFKEVSGVTPQEGRIKLLVPAIPYDVDVYRTGWRSVHLKGVQTDQVVRLKRGMSVRLILDGSGDLPAPPYCLGVSLFAEVHAPNIYGDGGGSFSRGREITFLAGSTGPHEVVWYLESGGKQSSLFDAPHTAVEIRDTDEEQVIHLDLTSDLRTSWEAGIRRTETGVPSAFSRRRSVKY